MRPHPGMLQRLLNYVVERQRIYLRRQAGRPRPWTADPILRAYRFCNVYREQDKVTQWIDNNIRMPFRLSPNLWFMLCAARHLNWPGTLQELLASRAWPVQDYSAAGMTKVLLARKQRGDKVYTGAYIISGQRGRHARGSGDKVWLTCHMVLQPLWRDRALLAAGLQQRGTTLAAAHAALVQYPGWGDFLAAQVVADLKHTRYLRRAPDWHDWAVLGPGSTRGLNRLYPQRRQSARCSPLKTPWSAGAALVVLSSLRDKISAVFASKSLGPRLCLQDTQNCLCEFDKYERTRLGQGRPRATFDGGGV